MSTFRQPTRPAARTFRWLAAALPLLLIALGLLACRPDWHAAMHVQSAHAAHSDHGHPHDSHAEEQGCAIELFASGLVDSVAGASSVLLPVRRFDLELFPSSGRPTPASAQLEPPGRAPPLA